MRKIALGALTSVLLSTGVGAPVVSAPLADAQVVAGNDKGLNIENFIPQLNQLSLTVKKTPVNPNDAVPAGALPPGGNAGIPFTLSRVDNTDVSTTDAREAAKAMTVDQARAKGLTAIATQQTNDSGETRFAQLTAGLYLLEESAPDTQHDYRTSDPQLILLPLGDSLNQEFVTDSLIVTKAGLDATTRAFIRAAAIAAMVLPGVLAIATLPSILAQFPAGAFPGLPGVPALPGAPGQPGLPGQPGALPANPDAPGAPGQGDYPEQPGAGASSTGTGSEGTDGAGNIDDSEDSLASTGANVLWSILAGSILILFGIVLARRGKKGARNV
ncbi:hypothetical protein GCM10027157_01240 [Corynebacterium aquatimens]